MSEHNITISQIDAMRAAKDVLLASEHSATMTKMLKQNLATQQYKLIIINDCVSPNSTESFMTLPAAVDAYNAIDVREKSAGEITEYAPPQHVIDEGQKYCQCCPHCSQHPCDGVSAGGVCDELDCDCYGDKEIELEV